MKTFNTVSLVALSVLAFAPAAAYAQFGPMEQDVGSAIELFAEMTLEQTVVDLGTISDEEPKAIKVGFRNTGSGMLTIASLKGSCGCTVPELAKKVYKPGEGGVIDITFNPHGKRDAQQTTVTITSDDRYKPTSTITIKSMVKPNVLLEPQNVAFQQVGKGKGGKQILKVTGRMEGFSISEITSTNDKAFTAKVLGSKPVEQADGVPATEVEVEVTLNPEIPVGMPQATLTLRTNNPKSPLVNVTTFAEVVGDVVATPQKFFLNQLQSEQDLASGASNKLVLRHREGKPFTVKSAEVVRMVNGLEHTFTVEFKPEDDKHTAYAFTLLGHAPGVAGPVQGDVVVTTDIPGEETIKLNYFGMVAAKPGAAQAAGQPAGVPGASFKADPRGGGIVVTPGAKEDAAKKGG